jgi:hypothetical protein
MSNVGILRLCVVILSDLMPTKRMFVVFLQWRATVALLP